MPSAEITVCAADVTKLLREQHPDLAQLPVSVLANGWDNVIFRVGDELLARLPRRAVAVPLIVAEQIWLPVLAPRLPLPVPVPVRIGAASASYPFPWSLTPHLPGVPAVSASGEVAEVDHGAVAAVLGRFLGALHRPAPGNAPENALRGVPLADRRANDDRNASALGLTREVMQLVETLEAGRAAAAWAGPPLWLHGDLHPANLLMHTGRIGAVIDFGDVTSGDPATDLAVAWMMLPGSAREGLWAAYAASGAYVDDALVVRAKGWAAAFALAFLAHSADNAQIAAIGRTISRALQAERIR